MKLKKYIAIALAAVCVLSFAACGDSSSASSSKGSDGSSAAATDGSFSTISDGVLVMGTHVGFPPYEYYEGDTPVGIDVDVMSAIADKLGLELQIIDMDFSSIITSVQTGKIDVGAAGMTVTEERLKNVNFSDTYSTGVQVVIVNEDSDISTIEDLEGKLIGVQEGTTGHIYCSSDYGEENVVAYPYGATAVQALADGKVDCVITDNQPAKEYIKATPGLKILDTEYIVEDYAIAISKDNEPLLAAVNQALAELTEDGTIQTILDTYIKAE